jgi:hypothetical protein
LIRKETGKQGGKKAGWQRKAGMDSDYGLGVMGRMIRTLESRLADREAHVGRSGREGRKRPLFLEGQGGLVVVMKLKGEKTVSKIA